jgi:hypothetical protein
MNSRLVLRIFSIALGFSASYVPLSANSQTAAIIKEISKKTNVMPKVADCRKLGICDLKSVKTVERKIKVLLPEEQADYSSYMTDFRFVIEVDKPGQITKYGVIQFMRGCMFESELLPNGSISKRFAYVHKHFGKYQLMRHENWVIDSSHTDPLTSSFQNYGRFDLYKWNSDPNNLDADNANWYFHSQPPHGTVFKSELISTSGLVEGTSNPTARNSSIELESCLFKIDDVPASTDPVGTGLDKSKALWCSSWDHKFIYDHVNSRVETGSSIHPFCFEPSDWPY